MSNIEVESSDEEYHPGRTKHRNSWPSKQLSFSAKLGAEQNPFASPTQSSPKKASKRTSKAKQNGNSKKHNTGRWTSEEHKKFLEAIEIYGRDWKKVQDYVGTRTSTQARSHAQKVLPHPATVEANPGSHNSSSTTMTKPSPPSVKTLPNNDLRQDGSIESDDGSSEFQIFKVEKIKKNVIGRDRVNSENNVFRFNLATSDFVSSEDRHLKNACRKFSMNDGSGHHVSDLVGSPIKESIKEQFNEDEDEEVKELNPPPRIERHHTFEQKQLDWFEGNSLFNLHGDQQEMNLESLDHADVSDFPMDVDEGLGPLNSLHNMNDWVDHTSGMNVELDAPSHNHFENDIEMEDNYVLPPPTINNELV